MGFSLDAGVPAVTVFVQGILSFFSPCVLPLLPLAIRSILDCGQHKTFQMYSRIALDV